MNRCLYKWLEYGGFLRIIEEDSIKYLEMHRQGKWRRMRVISDNEYNQVFQELVDAFERGELPVVNAPV